MLTYFQRMRRWLPKMNQALSLCWIRQTFGTVRFVVPMGWYPSTPRKWLQISSLPWLCLWHARGQQETWTMELSMSSRSTRMAALLSTQIFSVERFHKITCPVQKQIHTMPGGMNPACERAAPGHFRSWQSSLGSCEMASLIVLQTPAWDWDSFFFWMGKLVLDRKGQVQASTVHQSSAESLKALPFPSQVRPMGHLVKTHGLINPVADLICISFPPFAVRLGLHLISITESGEQHGTWPLPMLLVFLLSWNKLKIEWYNS